MAAVLGSHSTRAPTSNLKAVFFTDPARSYILGDNALIKTSDGGLHWKSIVTPAIPNLTAVSFLDANEGYVAGEFGLSMKTMDYGDTWGLIRNRSDYDLYSLAFP